MPNIDVIKRSEYVLWISKRRDGTAKPRLWLIWLNDYLGSCGSEKKHTQKTQFAAVIYKMRDKNDISIWFLNFLQNKVTTFILNLPSMRDDTSNHIYPIFIFLNDGEKQVEKQLVQTEVESNFIK